MAELSYDRRGSGPPLVLIHGIGSHWQVWSPVLDEVSRHRDVIALDLPGFGASPPPPPTSAPSAAPSPAPSAGPSAGPSPVAGFGSVAWFADQVVAFLRGLSIESFEAGGSSLGGGIALELGRRGLASRVTAFSPVGFWSTPGRLWCQAVVTAARTGATGLAPALPGIMNSRAGRSAFCAPFYGRPGQLPATDALSGARALAAAPGFGQARDAFTRLRPWTYAGTGALSGIPVTIAWGTRDAVLPYRTQARRARTVLPAARHVPLPGCGHLPFADDPARCAALLLPQ
ncbi:alpha/beta fold hydrolase [Actinoplanes sp. NPDC023936]|uniref:alpha/beta fold hydrolase n=1 Tax=Actinoplanes sp. NPDC023936 TaxID=3154910 RepID=UPI0033C6812E